LTPVPDPPEAENVPLTTSPLLKFTFTVFVEPGGTVNVCEVCEALTKTVDENRNVKKIIDDNAIICLFTMRQNLFCQSSLINLAVSS
jgi:hypothetical protein